MADLNVTLKFRIPDGASAERQLARDLYYALTRDDAATMRVRKAVTCIQIDRGDE